MKPISIWEDKSNEKIVLDLEKEKIHFIFLWGWTSMGKSIFGFNFYKQLIENNSADEVWCIFLDFIQVDFIDRTGAYILTEPTYEVDRAFEILEDLAKNPERYGSKKVFVHIEENDLMLKDGNRFLKAIQWILEHNNNAYIVYSTSRLIKKEMKEINDMIDLKVVFGTYSKDESQMLLWNQKAGTLDVGEKIAMIHDKEMFLKPFTEKEMEAALDFGDRMAFAV